MPNATPASIIPGTADLRFSRIDGRTAAIRAFATSPAKLFVAGRDRTACWVYSSTLGGGLVGGDEIHITAQVDAGARALLTTQASTKVYRSTRPTRQTLTARVGDGALLTVVPDPIVCFAGARFSQHQRYDLARDATLVAVDWMTSGRHAAGERWAFSSYESRLDVRRRGERVLVDAFAFDAADGPVGHRMGRFDVLLTAIATGPLVSDAAASLHASVSRQPIRPNASCVFSTAVLRDGGVLVRMAGTDVEEVAGRLRTDLSFLIPLIGDDPWSRKW